MDCWASFFNTSLCYLHSRSCFYCPLFFFSYLPWYMMRKCEALVYRNIQTFWKFFNPKIRIRLGFWVVSIKYNYYTLCLFLDRGPYSFILCTSYQYIYIYQRHPRTKLKLYGCQHMFNVKLFSLLKLVCKEFLKHFAFLLSS